MPSLKLGTTVVKRTRSQMSDVQLHKYTKTALCGSSYLDLRFGLLGIKQLVRLLWSKLHMRPICIRLFKTGPSGYPTGLFGSPTASSGDPTGPSGDPSGRPYIAHCTMLPLLTKSCLKSD